MSNITERRPETQPPAAPPSRRRLIAIVLLCIALGGALLRSVAAPGSTARDIGTLMLLLWLPIIGNVVAWIFAKVRRATARAPEASEAIVESTVQPFAPQRVVELTLRPSSLPAENTPIPSGEHRCALVVDKEGFSARWMVAPGDNFQRGVKREVEIEFMVPALALHRMQPGTAFRMLVGESFVGDGRVLRVA